MSWRASCHSPAHYMRKIGGWSHRSCDMHVTYLFFTIHRQDISQGDVDMVTDSIYQQTLGTLQQSSK